MTVNLVGSVIQVTGSNFNDTYRCYQVGTEITVEEGPVPSVFKYDTAAQVVTSISVNLMDGRDEFIADPTVQIPITASGGDGFDVLVGGSAADNLSGGEEPDALTGWGGDDTLTGGLGADHIVGGEDDDSISGGDGNDTIAGEGGHDTIDGGDHNDSISGGKGNDTIDGYWGVDRIHGDEEDDTIYGDIGNDLLWGDHGYDYIDGGIDSEDRIWGGTENDTLLGSSGNDRVWGEQGTDVLDGGEGNDMLDGGVENDTLSGSAGRDTLNGGDATDDLDGGTEGDLLNGDGAASANPGDDVLKGGDGNDRLNGDGGADSLFGQMNNDTLSGGLGQDVLRGGDGPDTVRGGDGKDRLYGGNGADSLFGDNSADDLYGEAGADSMDGGAGEDTLVSIDDATTDTLVGGAGKDSFWADQAGNMFDAVTPSADEAETNTHLIEAFENGPDKTLDGDAISEPAGGNSSEDFGGRPLFGAAGPQITDITQGALGDCWLLSSLGAALTVTPNVIQQLVVDLGDGTYAVHLEKSILNNNKFYRVDTDLPVANSGDTDPQFAKLGADDSLWVALVEKAYAIDRGNDYQALAGDDAWTPLGQIGGTGRVNHLSVADAFRDIANLGLGGVWCTQNDQADVDDSVASHCYTITNVTLDGNGDPTTIELYNPWGVDGLPVVDANGDIVFTGVEGEDDGFITLTLQQAQDDGANPFGAVTADFSDFN
jgi:Ca2+-binding RTX toxin-like protein